MSGFARKDAQARSHAEVLDACALLSGRLVLEVESALVREYPHVIADRLGNMKQPLLLLWVRHAAGGTSAESITFQVAPEVYREGEPILDFAGRRLLDQPLRLVRGRALDLRLAENDRTVEPEWQRVANEIGTGLGSLVLTGPSRTGFDRALGLLSRLDRDDLILLWSIEVDGVLSALGSVAERRAVRYRLATARRVGTEPSAEMSVLFYLEPESGCALGARAPPSAVVPAVVAP